MKKLLAVALLILSGCVTGPDGKRRVDPLVMSRAAEAATYQATSIMLGLQPEFRQQFEDAREAVKGLLATGNFDTAQLAAVLQDLPLPEGPEGAVGMIVIDGAIALWGMYGERLLDLDHTATYATYIKPVAESVLHGLDHGLAN